MNLSGPFVRRPVGIVLLTIWLALGVECALGTQRDIRVEAGALN